MKAKIDLTFPHNLSTVTNCQFLDGIKPTLAADEYLCTRRFKRSPDDWVTGTQPQSKLTFTDGQIPDYPDKNTSVWTAVHGGEAPNRKGVVGRVRSAKTFRKLVAVAISDVASKRVLALESTWTLETSCIEGRSRQQVGYRLTEPLTDVGIAKRLLAELAKKRFITRDQNDSSPAQWVRLPVGSNTRYDPPHPHRLVHFDPEITTSLEALIVGLGLDRDAIMNGSVTVPALTQPSSYNDEPTEADREQVWETITDDDGCPDGITPLSDDRSDIQTQSEKPPVEDALTVDTLVDDRQADQVIEQPISPDPPKPTDHGGDVPLHDLATTSFELLRFLIDSILPRGQTTVLASLDRSNQRLALVMAAHVATGRAWGSLAAEKGRVLYVALEDPGDLVKQLIRGVCEHYNLPMEMVAAYLHLVDWREAGPLVRTCLDAQGERVLHLTPSYTELLRRAADMDLVVIDAASSAFGGDETDYIQVRSIIRHLDAMVTPQNGAVLLLTRGSQVSAPRWSNGMGLTAWDQAVRSRLWLIEQTNRLELHSETDYPSRQRNPPIRLSWSAQCVLIPDVKPQAPEQALDHQKQSDEAIVLECFKRAIHVGQDIPKATSGTSKSWDVLKDHGLSPELMKDRKRVYSALERLNDQGVIGIDRRPMPNRQSRDFWVLIETQTDITQNQL